jgi:hypothetical protein
MLYTLLVQLRSFLLLHVIYGNRWLDARDGSFKNMVLIIQSALEVIQTLVCIELIEIVIFTMFSESGVLGLRSIIWMKLCVHIGLPTCHISG